MPVSKPSIIRRTGLWGTSPWNLQMRDFLALFLQKLPGAWQTSCASTQAAIGKPPYFLSRLCDEQLDKASHGMQCPVLLFKIRSLDDLPEVCLPLPIKRKKKGMVGGRSRLTCWFAPLDFWFPLCNVTVSSPWRSLTEADKVFSGWAGHPYDLIILGMLSLLAVRKSTAILHLLCLLVKSWEGLFYPHDSKTYQCISSYFMSTE